MSRRWVLWPLTALCVLGLLVGAGMFAERSGLLRCREGRYIYYPSWACDGREIVFQWYRGENWTCWTPWGFRPTGYRGACSVMKVSADGGKPIVLARNAWNCSCSPRLPLVGYVSGKDPEVEFDNDLWLMDLRTGKQWRLAEVLQTRLAFHPANVQFNHLSDPTWSWSPSTDQVLYRGRDSHCYLSDPWEKQRIDVIEKLFPKPDFNLKSWDAHWAQDGLLYLRLAFDLQNGKREDRFLAVNVADWTMATLSGYDEFYAPVMREWQRGQDLFDDRVLKSIRYSTGECCVAPFGDTKVVYTGFFPWPGSWTMGLVVLDRNTGGQATIVVDPATP